MKKLYTLYAVVFSFSFSAKTQTLFTYGSKKADATEFIQSFNKVNPDGTSAADKEKSIREYLDLYINSKLKILAAYEQKLDAQPSFKEELKSLRTQVMENYLLDPESYNILLDEAFVRSQKDIRVQHIFMPYKTDNNVSDSMEVKLKIKEAYNELVAGKKFEEVALKYSADVSVIDNQGDIGFITVFTLPYSFENIIYSLTPGKFSSPFKSSIGYHIFKNAGERKAVGKIKIAQILLAVPKGSDESVKTHNARLADSLYQRLKQGDDFAKLAAEFSNDYVSAASGGQVPEFSIGSYDPEFENAIISMPGDQQYSKPFLTSHGYHIVKRISITPPASEKNKASLDPIRIVLDKDSRIEQTRDLMLRRLITKVGYKQSEINFQKLNAYVDSLAENKPAPAGNTLKKEMHLFNLGDISKTVGDLVSFAQTNRWLPNLSGVKPFQQVMDEFKLATALEYYKNHLEEYNKDFRKQMTELKDGNMFFDIMMKEVWGKAQTDSTGQLNYYKQHLKKYMWTNSADAVIFYCGDENLAAQIRESVSGKPEDWKQIIDNFSDRSTADSGRFELSKIPGLKNTSPAKGLITPMEINHDDHSAAFAYILNIYDQPAQKSFSEAKGDVITDYQDELDKRWINALRKKYPVVIDQKVLNSILK